tara:strand:- start:143 stop:820 length:678 start_codon:yes stop_codon:yes gene_type:complete
MVFFLFFFLVFFLLPKFWLSYSMKKGDKELVNMPFNAEEFGKLILKENDLTGVKIEETQAVDHYDLNDRTVRVKEGRLEKKSLTSLTIVCHEIGHAIQHNEEYEPLVQRTNLVQKTQWISRLGGVILYSALPLILATGSFGFIKLSLLLVICSVLVGVLIHLITLNVEIDASFNRAMPILKEKIPEEYHAQCNNVLKAAAFTYVIGALTSFLSLRYLWLLISRVR